MAAQGKLRKSSCIEVLMGRITFKPEEEISKYSDPDLHIFPILSIYLIYKRYPYAKGTV